MQKIANVFKISKSSILHQFDYFNYFHVWLPYKQKKTKKKTDWTVFLCVIHYNEKVQFLKQIVTGNKNWILINNVEYIRKYGKVKLTSINS